MTQASDMMRITRAMLLGCAMLASSLPAAAQDGGPNEGPSEGPSARAKETARALYRDGNELYAKGEYQAALRSFKGAHGIMGVTTTGLGVGKTQVALGLLVEARDTLLGVTRKEAQPDEPASIAEAREEAKRLAEGLAGRIPSVKVVLLLPDGSEARGRPTIRIDKVELESVLVKLPVRLNPGEHLIVVSLPGYRTEERRVILAERNARLLNIELVSATPKDVALSSAKPVKPAAGPDDAADDADKGASAGGVWLMVPVGFALGGLGIVVGAIAGGVSLSLASDIEDVCDADKTCPADAEEDIDVSVTTAHISTVSFIIGGIGLALGFVGLVVAEEEAAAGDVALRPVVGPGYLGVEGSF